MSNSSADLLYSDEAVSNKRKIIMDLLGAILDSPRKESAMDLWKLHIDAALDRLDANVYQPIFAGYLTTILAKLPEKIKEGGWVGKKGDVSMLMPSAPYNAALAEVKAILEKEIKELKG